MIPGIIIGVVIRFKTKPTDPPEFLLLINAIISFVMAILYIKFSSDTIMDLLRLLGFISRLPTAFFGLTVIAWGNSLGDIIADVAMTKKGYGEMAMTGTMAGPIFNVMIGTGISMTMKFSGYKDPFSASVPINMISPKTNELNPIAVLPFTLLCGQLIILFIILANLIINNYKISFKFTIA